jgi:hypothetical protein
VGHAALNDATVSLLSSGGSRGICSAPRLPLKGLGFASSHTHAEAPEGTIESFFRSLERENPLVLSPNGNTVTQADGSRVSSPSAMHWCSSGPGYANLRMDVVVSRDAAAGERGWVCSAVSLNLLINSGLLLRRSLAAVRCAQGPKRKQHKKVEVNDQGSIPSCSLYVT